MTDVQVERIAQGHVFSGQDAQKIGLVDQLGGLEVAIAKAIKLAKISDHSLHIYPEQPSLMDQLLQESNPNNYLSEQLRVNLGDYYEPFALLKTLNHQSAIQARIPYSLTFINNVWKEIISKSINGYYHSAGYMGL